MTGEKQKLYIARSPESYVEDIEARIKEAKKIVPELLALQRKKSDKPNILYFEGVEGLRQAYDYKLKDFKDKEIVGFFARAAGFDNDLQEAVFLPWNEKKVEYNIKVRGFTMDDPKLVSYKKFFDAKVGAIEAKFLPETIYSADCSFESFEWGVRIVIIHSKQAIIIESGEVALAIKQIFELLWKKTEGEYEEPQKF